MGRDAEVSKQVCKEIEQLVKEIENYNGKQGHAERAWRSDQQDLLYLLSQNPFILCNLNDEIKEKVRKIVDQYLGLSFNSGWEY